eukprot:scaffold16805_cov59-Phaeocystis_antarctica.AAC.2
MQARGGNQRSRKLARRWTPVRLLLPIGFLLNSVAAGINRSNRRTGCSGVADGNLGGRCTPAIVP